jgi:hypothetical protein
MRVPGRAVKLGSSLRATFSLTVQICRLLGKLIVHRILSDGGGQDASNRRHSTRLVDVRPERMAHIPPPVDLW